MAPAALDARTLQQAQRGEKAAQEAFLRRYVGPMHALVRRSGAPGDVDDLTQELLHTLLERLPRFRPEGPAELTTWVFTVAQRWLLDVCKRRRLLLVELEAGREVADPRPPADELLEASQRMASLERAIAALPLEQRRLFVLAHVHQRPLAEISELEGVPVGTVKSRLHRARAALAALLLPPPDEEGGSHGSAGGA